MYKRFILLRADKDSPRKAEKHDEIYNGIDEMFGDPGFVKKVLKKSIIDTKFFVDEIADNFLSYDGAFSRVTIDLWISRRNLDVEITVCHDGVEFNPIDDNSPCVNIRAAAERLKLRPPYRTNNNNVQLNERFGLKYMLEAEEEV